MRKLEAIRDRELRGAGTSEEFFMEHMGELGGAAIHWRKPLRIDEVARLAPTVEVRARPGRA